MFKVAGALAGVVVGVQGFISTTPSVPPGSTCLRSSQVLKSTSGYGSGGFVGRTPTIYGGYKSSFSGVLGGASASPAAVEEEEDEAEQKARIRADEPGKHSFVLNPARWRKKTKQVATLGPASCTLPQIEKLFLAGADVFRLNFSHGAHHEKAELIKVIREIEHKYSHPICILADLQGPKLRVDIFEKDKVTLKVGQMFRFDMEDEPGDSARVKLPHPEIINTLRENDVLLLDDGKLKMTVKERGEGFVNCLVNVGGKLSNKKGVNTPTVTLPISPMTKKDRADLEFILTQDVDVVALSFVQKPEDIIELRALAGPSLKIMAKIEKPQAVEQLEEIVKLCDAIMVARGDLGVEMQPEDVPVVQKQIIDCCRMLGKPVVVATQMLESMIENPTPTRAEASDVATAIYDGADGIMLSAESAAGLWPEESVAMQARIISRVEGSDAYHTIVDRTIPTKGRSATDAITRAAFQVALSLKAAAIVTFTVTGTTCAKASQLRPSVPILGITPSVTTARALALSWGVYPAVVPNSQEQNQGAYFRQMLGKACSVALRKRIAQDPTDLLVVTAGLPFGTPGVANILRVVPAAGPDIWDPSLLDDSSDENQVSFINYDTSM